MSRSTNDDIVVKTHVARDFLQSAAVFKNDRLVVWEYVANSIQYTDPGRSAVVKVTIDGRKKTIAIADNGRGMDWHGLQNFFVMHGENIDRKSGRPGRGRFGTGKSAAFGIADLLRITTARNGVRSCVVLRRADVTSMKSNEPIPVRVVDREVRTSAPNGTLVEIEEIHLKALDVPGIEAYIQRHLARCPKDVSVFVNGHECEYFEPAVALVRRTRPEGGIGEAIGDVELIMRVSKAPLDADLRGISIFSNSIGMKRRSQEAMGATCLSTFLARLMYRASTRTSPQFHPST